MKARGTSFNPYNPEELKKHLEKTLSLIFHNIEIQQITEIIKEVYGENDGK
jgi:hypothetical protein